MTVSTSNYVTYYDPAKSHHRAWLQAVLDRLVAVDPTALEEGSELRDLWKAAVETNASAAEASWDAVCAAAKGSGAAYPELVAAQWALESGFGKHTSGKNNYFGLKGPGTTVETREFDNGRWTTVSASFLDFPDLRSCVAYLVERWYLDYKGYQGVNQAADRDAAARQLVSQGYATDPQYAEKLIQLMNQHAPRSTPPPLRADQHLLKVKYFSQRDSDTDQALRMCFSSSNAMLVEYIKPGTLTGANGDDQYLKTVQKHGDTTSIDAQLKALASYGIKARFSDEADFLTIQRQIDAGVPVPCGYLHRGPVASPAGGGHWLIVIGYTETEVIVNDPFGEPDLVNGTTLNSKGAGLRFSRENFGRRWMVQPLGGGTYRYAPGRGWAIVAER